MSESTRFSNDLKVRKAVVSDAEAVCAIYNQAIEERSATFETEPRTESEVSKWIVDQDGRHPLLVALACRKDATPLGKDDETVVGWASISTYRPRSCYSGIGEFSIYVKQPCRGRRIGKRLMTSLIEEAARLGYWKLVSRIFTFNLASRNLCRSCGFREVGIYEKHGKLDGKWLDTVIVERLIDENLM